MTKEQMEELWRTRGEPVARAAFEAGYEAGFNDGQAIGLLQGLEIGQQVGYENGVNDCKSAVSDGLRNGSSECGRLMRTFDK